jgi:hypothetical protein
VGGIEDYPPFFESFMESDRYADRAIGDKIGGDK